MLNCMIDAIFCFYVNGTQHGDASCELVLIANKADLAANRVVTVEEGQACADKYDAPYFEGSARCVRSFAESI